MKVEQSNVVRLQLTELKRLDPVTVFLEEFGPGRGRITIECFGQAWSSFWPAMGCSLPEFFIDCNNDYLAKNLAQQMKPDIYDFDKLEQHLKREILRSFFHKKIDRNRAEALLRQASDIDCSVTQDEGNVWLSDNSKLLYDVLGDEWYYGLPMQENPDYTYLCRIIDNVRAGLVEYLKQDKGVAA